MSSDYELNEKVSAPCSSFVSSSSSSSNFEYSSCPLLRTTSQVCFI